MGVLTDSANLTAVRAKVAENFRTGKVQAKKLRRKSGKTVGSIKTASTNTTEFRDSNVMSSFTLPAEYAFVGRALTQMDGVGKSLDPDFDFVSAAAPWIYEIKGASRYLQEEFSKRVENLQAKISEFLNADWRGTHHSRRQKRTKQHSTLE